MKKLFLSTFVVLFAFIVKAQDDYRLKYNEETNRVFYQGIIENADAKQADLYTKGVAWFEEEGKKSKFQDEEVSRLVGEATFSTVGKSSAYSKTYHYNFTCEITLEFKDGKTRYTLDNFKKKSSPGEPGSTLEYFIDNYKPKISSKKSRDREAKMLDEIEIAIDSQIGDLIVDLKKTFGPETDGDW